MSNHEVMREVIRRDMEFWRRRMEDQPHHPIEKAVEPAWRPEDQAEVVRVPSNVNKTFGSVVDKRDTAVYRPAHYQDGGIEAIDFIRAKLGDEGFIAYCNGNAMKYLSRAGKKGQSLTQDLEKAHVYIGWAIEASLGNPLTK